MKVIHVTPARLSDNHILERVSCIRPKHEDGYQLYGEIKHDKLLIHNYGHSGSGWTLLFGIMEQLIEVFDAEIARYPHYKDKAVCVIGAGCMGLFSAITLAQKGYQVRIIAKEFEHIASDKAAGLFFPYTAFTSRYTKYKRAQETSLRVYTQILRNAHPFFSQSCAEQLPQYVDLSTNYSRLAFWGEPQYVTLDFGNGTRHNVREYSTLFIHTLHMMHSMRQEIARLGIPMHIQYVTSYEEIHESIIINCTGFGARLLNKDPRLIPVQGHLIRLTDQPEQALRYSIHVKMKQHGKEELLYYAPKASGILGITYLEGQDDITANNHEFNHILERARTFFGTL